MNSIELLNNTELRNFIYDDSNRKVLIGSRMVGKTTALCYNILKNSISIPRDSVLITGYSAGVTAIKDTLMNLCNNFDISVQCTKMLGEHVYRINIEQSNVYIMAWNTFLTSYRHLRVRDIYIDEPNAITASLDDILTEVDYRTLWANNNSKLIIAGSSSCGSNKLRDISSNITFSRHVAIGHITPELQLQIRPESFRTEMLCEFI